MFPQHSTSLPTFYLLICGVWCMSLQKLQMVLYNMFLGERLQVVLEALDTIVESVHPYSAHGPTNIWGVRSTVAALILQATPNFVCNHG